MNKPKFETPDLTSQNIDKIAALFPNCVTEMRDENGKLKRAVNFEMLKQMLSPDVVYRDECYEFTWVGKKASIVEANKPIRKTLRPCPEESKNWDTTENLYIEGDNLEVLKLLQEAYLGKVKMIYIDPPYNTGNDFIYADDFMRSQEEENERMGMYDEDENRLFKNTDTNGRFHSDWCSMMYSRLMLARNLLAEDGVIFISIDENENSNMKKICEEVFGAANCVGIISNTNNPKGRSDDKYVATAHEYIHVYAKSINSVDWYGFEPTEEIVKRYNKVDTMGKRYREIDLRKTGENDLREDRPNLFYYFYYNENTGNFYPSREKEIPTGFIQIKPQREDGKEGNWRWGLDTAIKQIGDLIPKFMPTRKVWGIMQKDYLEGRALVKPTSSWTFKDVNSERGTEEFIELDFDKRVFLKPKPVGTIKRCIKLCSQNDDDIVLDFFSGSATTAHAVMQLNAEERQNLELSLENLDKRDPDYQSKFQALSSQLSQTGKRKFIMVQLPEPCDEKSEAYKAGYQNICEIGKERIRRAGRQILERSLESLEKEGLIEKYAGELSEIRSLEEVYGVGGAGVSSHQEAATGGNLRIGRSDASGSGFDSVEYRGGTVAGNAGVYPVFESGKGITSGTGDTVVALCPLAVLNELGYRVCLERFRGNQQNALLSDQISKLQALNSKFSLDIGFRVLKLADGNMKDVYYAAEEYDQDMLRKMESNIKEDRTDLDLLFGCLLDWGLPLSMPHQSEQIDGCTVHTYNDGDLIACFDKNIPENVVKEIAKRKPLRAVFRDSSFADSPSKINVFEIFKLYMPEDANDISKRVMVI